MTAGLTIAPGAATAALRVDHVSHHFGSLEVLRDVSFSIRPGEIVALLGASGCGKSTLLNLVAGLESLQQGGIGLPPSASLGYMFQEDRLLPWLNVRDNVAFGLEASRLPLRQRRQRALDTLALVGLDGFAQAWPHELSGGMRSRAALARTLVMRPDLLLMDEPFSKLDPQTRTQMHDELLRIQAAQHTTILFVTHDVEEAVVLADRIVLLAPRPGRIREVMAPALPRPRHATDPGVAETVRQLRLKVQT
ncbi:nitrate/sulfonate/bicarbonate ABC transporter ATP-binding protein [Bordetella genomosp. 7]|uniref:Nitrate/sulfonate/bicarbonate ABC transporter ATP-binding protein n=1 Tax=Bordetella genomosp. 7 TaxID=1416805 RepID=A0A261QZM5_9BORD|nr:MULTISPECIES: ABC transporter ATP-binding protein [Bordetella]OZI18229.1 nitrate/sulfonate/bicarbonate ABC transporter ATP-binding protein [Bordetella genomosp. 7]OZI22028.1 nitrate/sulfonate/bicarbonate ABC transporter ATP-binding protein [Bordetella genomosp. 7]